MAVAPERRESKSGIEAASFTINISGVSAQADSSIAKKIETPALTKFLPNEKLSKTFLTTVIVVLVNVILLRASVELPSLQASRAHLLALLLDGIALVTIPLAVWCSIPIYRRAFRLFKAGLFSFDACFLAANIVTVVYALLALFVSKDQYKNLSFAYSPIFLLLSVAAIWWLLAWAGERVQKFARIRWFDHPKSVRIIRGGESVLTTTDNCKVGDVVRVEKGERIVCDGIAIDGIAEVNELRLSALPERLLKVKGSELYSGSSVINGALDYRVVSEFKDSQLSFFCEHLDSLEDTDQQLDKQMLQLASGVSFGILAGAVLGAAVVLFRGADALSACFAASSILLTVMVPVAISFAGLSRSMGRTRCFFAGIFCKSLKFFSLLSQATNLVIDPEDSEFQIKRTVKSFDLFDDRLDRPSVSALIVSLLAAVRDEKLESLGAAIYQICDKNRLQQVTSRTVYGSSGVVGEIEGVSFVFGDEGFLISQGVVFQSSDIDPSAPVQQQYFLSLNRDVIARVVTTETNELFAANVVQKLRDLKVRTTLLTTRPQEWADSVGKSLGLELSQVFGGLTAEKQQEKLSALDSFAHLSYSPKPQFSNCPQGINIAFFNELLWELDRADATLLKGTPAEIVNLFRVSREHRLLFQVLTYSAGALSAALYILALLQMVTPLEVVAALAVFVLLTVGALWGTARTFSL